VILAAAVLAAVLAAGPAAAHHVGAYVPRDNAVSANFKEIKFALGAGKPDVARRLFERGELRAEMRARAGSLPPGLEAGTAAALRAGDAREAERHLMIFFSALARDLAREAERHLADLRASAERRRIAAQRFLEAIWRYYNLIDFAVSTRDSKTSAALRLAFDEAESYVKGAAAPADLERLRAPLGRIAQLLSNLIDTSSTSARRDS
jgi:hypothetical protein